MHDRTKGIAAAAIVGITLWPAHVQEHPLTQALAYATWEVSYPGFIGCGTPSLMARQILQSSIARGELPSYFQIPERPLKFFDRAQDARHLEKLSWATRHKRHSAGRHHS